MVLGDNTQELSNSNGDGAAGHGGRRAALLPLGLEYQTDLARPSLGVRGRTPIEASSCRVGARVHLTAGKSPIIGDFTDTATERYAVTGPVNGVFRFKI